MENVEAKFPKNPPLKTQKLFLSGQICLRILATITTLAATWVMLSNKQSILFAGFTIEARYSYSPSLKFFVYANAIACAFSLLSLLFLFNVGLHGSNPIHYFILFLHDLVMMSLILAGCAAATAIGYLGKYGNSHTGWMAICDHFGRFCNKTMISLILSYLSLVFLLMLTVTSASKSRQIQV